MNALPLTVDEVLPWVEKTLGVVKVEEMQPAGVRAPLADRYAQAALDLDTLALLGG
jgi:hypothetical protein